MYIVHPMAQQVHSHENRDGMYKYMYMHMLLRLSGIPPPLWSMPPSVFT